MYNYISIFTQQTGASNPEVIGWRLDTIKNKTPKPVKKKYSENKTKPTTLNPEKTSYVEVKL